MYFAISYKCNKIPPQLLAVGGSENELNEVLENILETKVEEFKQYKDPNPDEIPNNIPFTAEEFINEVVGIQHIKTYEPELKYANCLFYKYPYSHGKCFAPIMISVFECDGGINVVSILENFNIE